MHIDLALPLGQGGTIMGQSLNGSVYNVSNPEGSICSAVMNVD